MKFFSVIFIFYLLFSIWQSCQTLTAETIFCSLAAEKVQSDDSKSGESEDCSEFCGCSASESIDVETNSTISFSNKFFVLTKKPIENNYQNYPSQNYLESIWQPPKTNFTA